MLVAMLLFAQAVSEPTIARPVPSAEALVLGRRLAESGTLAGMLPLIAARETDGLVAAHPELSGAEQAELRRAAQVTLAAEGKRLFAAQGRAYAERLSLADLRVLVAQTQAPATARYRAILPAAIAATMAVAGGLDFKKDVLAAFCAKTGKGCVR